MTSTATLILTARGRDAGSATIRILAIVLALLIVAPAVPAANPGNAERIFEMLRALAGARGLDVPDASSLTADVATSDGTRTVPLVDAFAAFDELTRAMDVASALGRDPRLAPSGMKTGVGDSLHAYGHAVVGSCDARRYSVETYAAMPAPLDQPAFVPNPAGAPILGVAYWGGSARHVSGGGYAFGLHVFAGAPLDVNVNTENPPVGLATSLDSTIDAYGVGQLVESNSPIRVFGVCVGAIALGALAQNGSLTADGQIVP